MVRPKILIVEDDKSLVKILEEALDKEKFEVILTMDASQAIKKARLEKPNIIILDVMLPGKSGFTCLQQLKNSKETKNIPAIILSNLGQAEEIKKGLELGAVDYLVKANFSIDEIIKKILKYLKKN
ncbi:MAG: response regulator [Candidatus Buchananbacteria bacterium]|nr:response regulator [Candidatus Buchananbacteria bacterium]